MRRAVLLVMASCGRIAFDPQATGDVDAGDASLVADTSLPAGCSPFQPGWVLDPAQAEPSLASSTNDTKPFLTPDGLTMFFISDAAGDDDVWTAQRAVRGGTFSGRQRYAALSADTYAESGVSLADDLTAIITSNRVGSTNQDLWQSTWNTSGVHQVPVLLGGGANTASWEYEPTVTPDGSRIYYVTENYPNFPGGGDPVFADRTGVAAFGAPTLVAEMASANNEYGFTVSRDGLVAMVASDRDGPSTVSYIYVSVRDSTAVPFPPPVRKSALEPSTDQGHAILSPDGCEIWFGAFMTGRYQLYVARWREL